MNKKDIDEKYLEVVHLNGCPAGLGVFYKGFSTQRFTYACSCGLDKHLREKNTK